MKIRIQTHHFHIKKNEKISIVHKTNKNVHTTTNKV